MTEQALLFDGVCLWSCIFLEYVHFRQAAKQCRSIMLLVSVMCWVLVCLLSTALGNLNSKPRNSYHCGNQFELVCFLFGAQLIPKWGAETSGVLMCFEFATFTPKGCLTTFSLFFFLHKASSTSWNLRCFWWSFIQFPLKTALLSLFPLLRVVYDICLDGRSDEKMLSSSAALWSLVSLSAVSLDRETGACPSQRLTDGSWISVHSGLLINVCC